MRTGLGAIAGVILSTCGAIPEAATQPGPQDVAALISRQQPGFRLSKPDDFWPKLAEGLRGDVSIQADLDRDGQIDSAVLVINENFKEYRVYLVRGGQENLQLLFSRRWTALSGSHPIRTPMFLKPAGEARPRSYSPLTGREAAAYTAAPAIEVWSGAHHDERDVEGEELAYCSEFWYYDQGQLKHFRVCD